MEPELQTLGVRIGEIREARGLGLRQATALTGGELSPTGLLRIEDESRVNPKVTTLVTLCAALGMKITIDPNGVLVEQLEPWIPPSVPREDE